MELEEQKKLDEKLRLSRSERYSTQSVSRLALPQERVSMCLRKVNGSNVKVLQHKKTKKAFYDGLLVCGSVWTCPVCAAKISERRRKELQKAFSLHKKDGGKIALLTLTFSHKKTDKLEELLKNFGDSTKKFMAGRAFQNLRDELDMVGRIRVLEVTYSRNGFHPHTHIALFYNNDVDLKYIKEKMYFLWEKACRKYGLVVNEKHGLDLQNGTEAEAYLSKHGTWGLDQELSKSHIKKGKNDSMSPFDFLRKYLEEEDEKYLILFREYAKCFKGKRQLQWSQGLKKRFILEDKTDEQLAAEKTEESDVLGMLDYEMWKKILRNDKRSVFLDLCERYGFEKAILITNKIEIKKSIKKYPHLAEEDTAINI